MKEDFLQYIWAQELCEKNYIAISGEQIEIIHPGIKNTDSGPDFLNARIKIDDTIWAGNIEIHTDSSNWDKHGHASDAAYNNVILHVVQQFSKPARRKTGETIPAIELNFDASFFLSYQKIIENKSSIPCHTEISKVHSGIINMWLNSLSIERLEDKTDLINKLLIHTKNSWEETFYIVLARSFGFHTNALPFELLAKSLPLSVVSKHHRSLLQLEALFYGQAGFLEQQISDGAYFLQLQKEYSYLRNLHKLTPIENHLWKFLRLRPTNFPTVRIAQFSNLIWRSQHLFSKTLESADLKTLEALFSCEAGEYWNSHFNFGKASVVKRKELGKTSLELILINTIIPFLFLYGKLRNKPEMQEKSMLFLEEMKPEKNSIIKSWSALGIKVENALASQALIQLTNNYCRPRHCLYCQIGNEIIRNRNI